MDRLCSLLVLLLVLLFLAAGASGCSRGVYKGGYDGGPRPVSAVDGGAGGGGMASTATVGPDGADLLASDGVFSLRIPAAAFEGSASVTIQPSSPGIRGTTRYRVVVTPPSVLRRPVRILFDLNRIGGTAEIDTTGLVVGSGADPEGIPTSALPVVGLSTVDGVFSGISFELDRTFGMVEGPIGGVATKSPICFPICCEGQVATVHPPSGCGCVGLDDERSTCFLESCTRDDLAKGCAP